MKAQVGYRIRDFDGMSEASQQSPHNVLVGATWSEAGCESLRPVNVAPYCCYGVSHGIEKVDERKALGAGGLPIDDTNAPLLVKENVPHG
jgi:hypothetical protein